MSAMDAMRSATSMAAPCLELDDLRVVAGDKTSDVAAVVGDPLSDMFALQNVEFVRKDGTICCRPQECRRDERARLNPGDLT